VLWSGGPALPVPSREIRRVVFEIAADSSTPRDEVLVRAGQVLGLRAEQVSEGLFADRSSERRLSAPPEEPSVGDMVDAYNLELVQEFLFRAEEVVVHAGQHLTAIARTAKDQGLMFFAGVHGDASFVKIVGPQSITRQRTRYARALADFLSQLVHQPDWSLDAPCLLGSRIAQFHVDAQRLTSRSPHEPRASRKQRVTTASQNTRGASTSRASRGHRVLTRFFGDFRKTFSLWNVVSPALPLTIRGQTFFPDLTLERGIDRVHVELMGFHSAAYLASRRHILRRSGLLDFIFCVDEALACSPMAAPKSSEVRFRRRIDVEGVLQAAEHLARERERDPESTQPST
jgi:predicted nuclease of restriction endonuclease-like RecB superfamily